jgi:translation initiation factor IF-2
VEEESAARSVAEARLRLARQATASSSLASMISQATSFTEGNYNLKEVIKVPLVLKGDVSGSVEALRSSLELLQSSDETATCFVDLVQSGIGEVTASDVAIAAVSKAKIVAFNVGVRPNVLELAKSSNVDIGFYSVVYDLLDEVEKQVKETISPPPPGILIGKAEVKKSFRIGKSGKVAGCIVTEGSIKSGSKVRVMRGNRNPIFTGLLSSLRLGKDTIAEVINGSECGMSFVDFQDFEEGDVVECFSVDIM